MNFACLVRKLCALMVTTTKGFTYSYSNRQLGDIFDGGNMVPHESVSYIRKINLQKKRYNSRIFNEVV